MNIRKMNIRRVVVGKGETPECCGSCPFWEQAEDVMSAISYMLCPLLSRQVFPDFRDPDCPLVEESDD